LSYKRQEQLALSGCLGLPPIFGGVSVAHLLVFCCDFVFLRPMTSVSNGYSYSQYALDIAIRRQTQIKDEPSMQTTGGKEETSIVLNVASFSGLSIIDCPFIYLALYFSMINASNKPHPKN
jgi:hypothetical protein